MLFLAVLLLGAWCAYTVQARQLGRATKAMRLAARRQAEAQHQFTGNISEVGLLSKASACATTLSISQVHRVRLTWMVLAGVAMRTSPPDLCHRWQCCSWSRVQMLTRSLGRCG